MSITNGNSIYNPGINADDVKSIIDATPNIKNVQADWNEYNSSLDSYIKNKPYYSKSQTSVSTFKICTFPKLPSDSEKCLGISFTSVKGYGGIKGTLLYKNNFKLYMQYCNSPWTGAKTVNLKYVVNDDNTVTIYATTVGYYVSFKVAPLINLPSSEIDFNGFGSNVNLPDGAVDIPINWISNSSADSGDLPVKVNDYGDLTPITTDSAPTENSNKLITSGNLYNLITNPHADILVETPPKNVYNVGQFYFVLGYIARCNTYSTSSAEFTVYGIVEALNLIMGMI